MGSGRVPWERHFGSSTPPEPTKRSARGRFDLQMKLHPYPNMQHEVWDSPPPVSLTPPSRPRHPLPRIKSGADSNLGSDLHQVKLTG